MNNIRCRTSPLSCLVLSAVLATGTEFDLHAAEYHAALDGDDARDGLSRPTAFQPLQHGVAALSPGDTLTIAPREYPKAGGREAAWFKPDHDDQSWRTDVPIEGNWQDFMEQPYSLDVREKAE